MKGTPGRRWRRGGRRTIALFGALLLGSSAFLGIQSCSMPGPKSTPQQVAALKRDNVAANAGVPMLSYLHAGSETDPRVIYIHGTPGEADGWADFLVDPVPGLEAVAVDRPGFGESGARDGSATDFEMQARAIAPLLVERQGKWPIVVGHSLGGPIAARLAAMYPDRVGGLVIVAGSLDPEQEKPGIGQEIATTGFVRFFLPQTLDNSMGELSAAKKQTQLLAPELKNVTCPVIVIHGTTDELVPYDNVAYIRKMLVNAGSLQVVTLEGQGHFIPWERPDTIRQAVKDLAEKQR